MAKNKKYIADYIYDDEIRCKCKACKADPKNSLIPFGVEQLAFWQKVSNARHIRGVPLIPVSGYRCPEHPESTLNSTSAHCQGLAVDFYEKGIALFDTFIFWERVFPWNGIGYNLKGGTLHIDDKPRRFARWKYKKTFKQGRYIYKPEYLILCKI